jgi:tetratricopeptide (TPR) repeat protein
MRIKFTTQNKVRFTFHLVIYLVLSFSGYLLAFPSLRNLFYSQEKEISVFDTIITQRKPAHDSVYSSILSKAQSFYLNRSYNDALTEYEKALKLKPDDARLKETIDKVKSLIAQQKKALDDYQKTIVSADNYFKAKDYLNAKNAYQLAIDLKPDDQYAKDRLKQTMELIRSQKAQNTLYDMAIASAEKLYQSKEYEKAKVEFEKARKILPDDNYAKERINEIIKILVDRQTMEEMYAKSIADADKFYNAKSYQSALLQYQNASSYKPDEEYPKDRITELTALIKSIKAKDDAYNKAIAAADNFFTATSYDNAKKEYQNALTIKPEETYPVVRIKQIDDILAGKIKITEEYARLVNAGDSLYIEKKFIAAKANYQQALKLKPGESYPKEMISKADNMIAGQAASEQATEEAYKLAINNADDFFKEKSYDKAKPEYQNALLIKPNENYPKTKIAEIDQFLAESEKQKSLDEQYTNLISEADKRLSEKSYPEAKAGYQSAMKIKPDQQYPKDKIKEIDNLLAEIAKQKGLEDQYASSIAKADKLLNDKLLEQSKAEYVIAGNIKPGETYPKQKIAEIDKLIADAAAQKAADDQYRAIVINADHLLTAKNYTEAKVEYSKALSIRPTDEYPQKRIVEIDNYFTGIAEAKAKDEQYKAVTDKADKLLLEKIYDEAKTEYQNALLIKPNENYPKTKVAEIDQILAEIAKQKSLDEQYTGLITDADKRLAEKSYTEAKTGYQSALKIKPEQQYPKDKIGEIDNVLAEIAKQKGLDEQYNSAIANADKLFADKLLEQSKSEYVLAGNLKPGETYPKQKIAEIDKLLADAAAQKALDEKYLATIVNADNLLSAKDYTSARNEYTNASGIKPAEQYPKDKIAEIDQALAAIADAKTKDEQFRSAIDKADKFLAAKSYEQARSEYQNALVIKPDENYPKEKVAEIDQILAEIAKQKSLDDQYAGLISQADKRLAEKSYTEAKTGYEDALKIKPDQQYPKDKLGEIDVALAEIAKQKALDDLYNEAIAKADQSFAGKLLDQAKTEYIAAGNLKPTEAYPKQKIAEIDKLLADAAAQKALDDKYQALIVNADNLLSAKNYSGAKAEYANASSLKPGEQYPKDKIAEIDLAVAAIADAKAKDEQYKSTIAKADKLFASKTYEPARTEYQNALLVKPDEAYPKDKIAEIDMQLAAIAKQKALDDQYARLVAEGDKKLAEKSFEEAKTSYQAAVDIKPEQQYPKGKIVEIDKALADISRKKALDDQYNAAIAKADQLLTENMLDESKAEFIAAGNLKPGEIYPKQKITEIDKLKAKAAQQKILDDKYEAAIQNADKLFAAQNYNNAKTEYTNASALKPQEQYPKDKIEETESILSELRAKEEAYKASIAKADQLLFQKSYEESRNEYTNAGLIKPSEQYPKNKITEINGILMQLKGKRETYDDLVLKGDDLFNQKDYYRSKDNFQQASDIFPEEAYPKQKLSRINSVIDSIYRANKGKYDKAVADGDKSFNSLIYDKALDSYGEALTYLPMEKYPKEMINKIKKAIAENAIVDLLNSAIVIQQGAEKQLTFEPVNIASRKNNYLYIKIKNLSGKPFNVLVRYGKDKQTNGGAVIRNLLGDGNVYDRLISVRDQDPWYREDNNWIALLPQGGDVEVTFIQISRAAQ